MHTRSRQLICSASKVKNGSFLKGFILFTLISQWLCKLLSHRLSKGQCVIWAVYQVQRYMSSSLVGPRPKERPKKQTMKIFSTRFCISSIFFQNILEFCILHGNYLVRFCILQLRSTSDNTRKVILCCEATSLNYLLMSLSSDLDI